MIIDCHTHLGRNEHIKANAKDLLISMDKAGIDKSLVFAGELNDCSNNWMLDQISPHKDRLYGVAAYYHPTDAQIDEDPFTWNTLLKNQIKQFVTWYTEGKIVAVKFYTGYDHFYPIEVRETLKQLEKIGCPVIFHSGDCLNSVKCAKLKYAHPIHIDEVAVDYPNMNFIIAHMAYPWQREAAEVCYKNDNVYADISGFVYGHFSEAEEKKFQKVIGEFLDIAGYNNLLFGTDWPISEQSAYQFTMNNSFDKILSPTSLTENTIKAFKLKI